MPQVQRGHELATTMNYKGAKIWSSDPHARQYLNSNAAGCSSASQRHSCITTRDTYDSHRASA